MFYSSLNAAPFLHRKNMRVHPLNVTRSIDGAVHILSWACNRRCCTQSIWLHRCRMYLYHFILLLTRKSICLIYLTISLQFRRHGWVLGREPPVRQLKCLCSGIRKGPSERWANMRQPLLGKLPTGVMTERNMQDCIQSMVLNAWGRVESDDWLRALTWMTGNGRKWRRRIHMWSKIYELGRWKPWGACKYRCNRESNRAKF